MDDDDEVVEVRSPRKATAAASPHSRPMSTRSHFSGGAANRRDSTSGFHQVQQVVEPHRKKPRKQLFASNGANSFNPAPPSTEERDIWSIPIDDDDDDDEMLLQPQPKETIRSPHFDSVKSKGNGSSQAHRSAKLRESEGQADPSYFPHSENARDMFKRQPQVDAIVDDQEDELASPLKVLERPSRAKSPSKKQMTGRNRGKNVTSDEDHRIPLSFFATYDVKVETGSAFLEVGPNSSTKLIVKDVNPYGTVYELCSIDLDKVNFVETDAADAVRLLGVKSGKQGRYWRDLRFVNPENCKVFLDRYVLANTFKTFTHSRYV